MSTVAEQLRGAREARNLTIPQVVETTKMRSDHVRALEEGNFDAFPAPVYIRGSVRAYATLLKLDVSKVMAALDAELGETEKYRDHPPLTKQQKGILHFVTLQFSKVNWKKGVTVGIALLIVAAIAGGIALWIYRKNADPLSEVTPSVYKSPRPGPGETLPLPEQPSRSR